MDNDKSWQLYKNLRDTHPNLFNDTEDVIRIVSKESEVHRVKDFRNQLTEGKSLWDQSTQLGVVFEDEYIIVVRDPVDMPNHGGFRSYLRILEKPMGLSGVVVFALYQNHLVLLHHFRHAIRKWSLEIPRGVGSSGDWQEDAARELLEEVGGVVCSSTNLGSVCSNTGILATTVNVVLANLKEIDPSRVSKDEQDPGIGKIELVTQERFAAYVNAGRVFDSYTLSAAYLVVSKKLNLAWN